MSARIHRNIHAFPMQHVWIPLGTTHVDVTLDSMSEMVVKMDRVASSHLRFARS